MKKKKTFYSTNGSKKESELGIDKEIQVSSQTRVKKSASKPPKPPYKNRSSHGREYPNMDSSFYQAFPDEQKGYYESYSQWNENQYFRENFEFNYFDDSSSFVLPYNSGFPTYQHGLYIPPPNSLSLTSYPPSYVHFINDPNGNVNYSNVPHFRDHSNVNNVSPNFNSKHNWSPSKNNHLNEDSSLLISFSNLSVSSKFNSVNDFKFPPVPPYLQSYLIGKVHDVYLVEYVGLGMIVQFAQVPSKKEIENGFKFRKQSVNTNESSFKRQVMGLIQWSVFPKEIKEMKLEERLQLSKQRIPVGSKLNVEPSIVIFKKQIILFINI